MLKGRTKIIHSIKEYRDLRNLWFKKNLKVGFVPTMRYWLRCYTVINSRLNSLKGFLHVLQGFSFLTAPQNLKMGALHAGHASLGALARKECDIVVASIFVNPAQFAPTEDLDKYPKTLEGDVDILSKVGTDFVFVPSVGEMYPAGIPLDVKKQTGTFVNVLGKSHQMEGQIRPHFFRGVATVVSKLFNIIQPTNAYFGQKDVQQCSVVKTMVRDLHFPLQVVVGDTVRESDGLAMSSRNRFLSMGDRALAPILYAGMREAIRAYEVEGIKDRKELLSRAESVIATKSPHAKLEYLSLAEPFGLEEVDVVEEGKGAILSGAIKLGSTRIIDNVLLGMSKQKL